jgi:biofilm PGA synthesis protein PgaA
LYYLSRSFFFHVLTVLNLFIGLGNSACGQETREQAVQLARDGRYQESIRILRKSAAQSDQASVYDLIVVLTWDRQYAEALKVWGQLSNRQQAPHYVKVAAAGALVNQSKPQDAIVLLKDLLKTEPDDLKAWLFLAQAYQISDQRFEALRAYAYAQRLDPDNAESREGLSRLLASFGGFNGAIAQSKFPSLALRADQAALGTRWADTIPAPKPEDRFNRIDQVLIQLNHLIEQAENSKNKNIALLRQLHCDRVVALRERERWSEAVKEAIALEIGGPLPAYVKQSFADALLALRQPERARTLYKEVLSSDASNKDAKWGLVFAELESENFYAAFEIADAMAQDQSPWLRAPKIVAPAQNDDWLSAQILAALLRSWSDMPQEAWDRLLPLAQAAPAMSELRVAMGGIAAARGWPRKSEQEIRIASSIDPENKAVKIALGESAIRRQQWGEARSQVAYLSSTYPEDTSVIRLARELSLHDKYELKLDFTNESQSGNAVYAPGSGYVARARVYSPSLNERWRMFAATERMTATVPESAVAMRNRFGLGAEYQTGDLTAEGVVWQNTGDIVALGASLNLNWKPTDHWSFEAGLSQFAGDTPLRAIYYGTTANSATAGVTYAWDDSRALSAVYKPYNFSDGNVRQSGLLSYSQKIISRPTYNITLIPSLYASTNTRQDVAYYSPSQDFAATLSTQAEHIIYRRYEQVFGGRFKAGVGVYQEANYAGGVIGDISYEQFYRPNDQQEITYGIGANHRIYDGTPENTFIVYLRLNAHF